MPVEVASASNLTRNTPKLSAGTAEDPRRATGGGAITTEVERIAEFVAALMNAPDERTAIDDALERFVNCFDADAGAFVRGELVERTLGWPPAEVPVRALISASSGERDSVDVSAVGPCHVVAVPLDRDEETTLVLARAERFDADELGLLRGVTRVFALGLRFLGTRAAERRQAEENAELVSSLRERRALLEKLARIQRKISTRAPLDEVLEAITNGAADLLGDEVVGLRLIDEREPDVMVMVASIGVAPELRDLLQRLPIGAGVGGRAITENRLCITERYQAFDGAIDAFSEDGLQAAMAAPVHLEGQPAGSLVVASHRPGRVYSEAERDILIAFAEHASLALNDARTVDAMNNALDEAMRQALHDDLTGLPNRACFFDRAEQALRNAARDGSYTAVLLFDLDRFKEINDTLGHKYGDRVLREIGPRIHSVMRSADTLARLGGDEFCVLLSRIDGVGRAIDVAQRVVDTLEAPFEIDGMMLVVEASCGIAVAPNNGDNADVLLQRADVAMYVAKNSHGSIVAYNDGLDVNTPDRLAMLGELRTAIAEQQLELHYQPQAHLGNGQVRAVEALVRWKHPTRGLFPPNEFIPMAEHTALIKPLTTWVLNDALRMRRRWLDDPSLDVPDALRVAINLSTRSLLDDAFPSEVVEALERWNVPPHLLQLEITESGIMADPPRARRLLDDLAQVGVTLSIDDFGTGYSSLAYLKNLPVNQLKIDQSFVSHMRHDPNDAIIVRSVIDLGRNLGLETVAEGVEDHDTWSELSALGCDSAQGFFLARPMEAENFVVWLRDERPIAAARAG